MMSEKRSTNGKKTELDKIRERRASRQIDNVADWGSADPKILLRAVETLANRGGALRLGYSRDGGAYAIGIYLSNDRYTEYVRPHEDINYYLQSLVEDFDGPPSPSAD